MTTTLPTDYREPHALQTGCLRTCRGIVIGGAIAPRLAAMDADSIRMQGILLDTRHRPLSAPAQPGSTTRRMAQALGRAVRAVASKAWALA